MDEIERLKSQLFKANCSEAKTQEIVELQKKQIECLRSRTTITVYKWAESAVGDLGDSLSDCAIMLRAGVNPEVVARRLDNFESLCDDIGRSLHGARMEEGELG